MGSVLSLFGSILFFYLCCSCICCCCGFRTHSNRRRYDLNDRDDLIETNKKRRNKESCLKKLFCCLCRCCCRKDRNDKNDDLNDMKSFSKKSNEVKYSLLENKDESFQFPGKYIINL